MVSDKTTTRIPDPSPWQNSPPVLAMLIILKKTELIVSFKCQSQWLRNFKRGGLWIVKFHSSSFLLVQLIQSSSVSEHAVWNFTIQIRSRIISELRYFTSCVRSLRRSTLDYFFWDCTVLPVWSLPVTNLPRWVPVKVHVLILKRRNEKRC